MLDKFRSYFFNIVLIIIVALYIMPDLVNNEKEHLVESGTIDKVFIETYKYKRRKTFRYVDRERLVVVTSDRLKREFKISDQYRKFWPKLLSKDAKGKYLRAYLRNSQDRIDPIRIELDNQVLYKKSDGLWYNLILVLITIGLTLFNLYKIMFK